MIERKTASRRAVGLALLIAGGWSGTALAQRGNERSLGASHVVVPQARVFAIERGRGAVQIRLVRAKVRIVEQTATTTLQIELHNPGTLRAEAVLLLPVPDGAAVSSFLFDGSAAEPTARLLPLDEARRTYESIVAQVRDPALLEFAGYSLVRSSLFPVEPGGSQKVRLTYDTLLQREGRRVDYMLPRSESLHVHTPWEIDVEIEAREPISTLYSPSHELLERRLAANRMLARVEESGDFEPGPFLLSYLLGNEGLSASLFAYPDPAVGGGYFLLMTGLPPTVQQASAPRRELTLVIDRSGSMAGAKLEQTRQAANEILARLQPGELFNVIDYATTVSAFARRPVANEPRTLEQARSYLAQMRPGGGTNIHDALLEALSQPATPGYLPIVLFLTDGTPTVRVTSESRIREMVERANVHQRRIFSLGVGGDLNAPLLDRISEITRGKSAWVLPHEEIGDKLSRVFRQLSGPVFADLRLETLDRWGNPTTRAVGELIPAVLPDLFDGDSLILLGQYRQAGPLVFRLTGSYLGAPRHFRFEFDLDTASTRNAFVPRLWADRRVGYLIDQIRQIDETAAGAGFDAIDDPRVIELTDEILRLSREFGILTEYTAFFAGEGTDLSDWNKIRGDLRASLDHRALKTRSGLGAVSQSVNLGRQKSQSKRNYKNRFLDSRLDTVEFSAVQQIGDRTFVRNQGRWIDARLIGDRPQLEPDSEIEFGSAEHLRLLRKLVGEGRQAALSLPGEILLEVDGKTNLVRNPTPVADIGH